MSNGTGCECDESAVLVELLAIHGSKGLVSDFDSKPVLDMIEAISRSRSDVMSEHGPLDDVVGSFDPVDPDKLRSLLHTISCVMSCKCSGGAAMEVMNVVSGYEWDAKITIVLAAFVADYVQWLQLVQLYRNTHIGMLVAKLKNIAVDVEIDSTFGKIIDLSIKVIKIIGNLSNLPSKYISKEEKTMADALNRIPPAVYTITRVVVGCFSKFTEILGQSTEISSNMETRNFINSFEQELKTLHEILEIRHTNCRNLVEDKKEKNFILKLKLKFEKTASYSNNQKILELLFKNKRHPYPLAFGPKKVGVEDLQGKTVLLFISDLDCKDDEMLMLTKFHQESRNNNQESKYEIVWLPIAKDIEKDQRLEQKFKYLKLKMPWYSLEHPSLLHPGVARFVKEEWHYSKNSILVVLDKRGKVTNPNALQFVSTWGNAAYPFTHTRESDMWSRKEWSLLLLLGLGGVNDPHISEWMNDQKVICLFGGKKRDWVAHFISTAREFENIDPAINLEMVYIGTDQSEELTETLNDNNIHYWGAEITDYFWKRMALMVQWETCHCAGDRTKKEEFLQELRKFNHLGSNGKSDEGWALISQGQIAYSKGDVLLEALAGFEEWRLEAEHKGFVTALKGFIPETPHPCKECGKPI